MASAPLAALAAGHGVQQARAALPPGVVRAALHVHSSFSEGSTALSGYSSRATMASMESQLAILRQLGADLCWFTDHDHQLAAESHGLQPEPFPTDEDLTNPHWVYRRELVGAVSGSAAMTTTGLSAQVTSGSRAGWAGMFVDCATTGRDYRAPLSGTRLGVVATTTSHGWVEVRVRCCYRPARSGRPAGSYEVHYRLHPDATRRSVLAQGTTAVVTIPHPSGQRATATVAPVDDLASAFPDLGALAHDNGLYGLWLGVGSAPGTSGSGTVHALRLDRSLTIPDALALRRSLISELAAQMPEVRSAPGLEASYANHVNILAGGSATLTFPDPRGWTSTAAYLRHVVSQAHADGAMTQYNHPFSTGGNAVGTPEEQARLLARVATVLQGNRLFGARLMEVGYGARGGAGLRTHLDLWDILLSYGVRIFATGTSDDHAGTIESWTSGPNQFFTDVLADSARPGTVLTALRGGRCYVSHRTGFTGLLDLSTPDARMGGEHRPTTTSTPVRVVAHRVPAGGHVQVQQRLVDRVQRTAAPPVAWSQTLTASQLGAGAGEVTLTVPSRAPGYLRTEVVDSAGRVVAFSNPLWITPA